jgi:2-polyprenyl-3-methyl-5-hydroxy-6-metoxy-1,4-benzoquinol methylase
MTCAHCRDLPDLFDRKLAALELKRYRRRGPAKTTRMLLDALLGQGVRDVTVLDIGGGVGAVQLELLAAGARRVVNADASPAYQTVVRGEAERRGTLDRIEFYLGDFVELAPALPAMDVVTLDRVICCYPDMAALVQTSAAHARSLWGAVFPRERRSVRAVLGLFNLWQRIRRKAFRVYVHPTTRVEQELRAQGLAPLFVGRTFVWQVMVWGREQPLA